MTAHDRARNPCKPRHSGLYCRDRSEPSNVTLVDAEWTSQPVSDPRLPVREIRVAGILGELRLQRGDDPARVGFREAKVGWNEHHPGVPASAGHDQLRVQRPEIT